MARRLRLKALFLVVLASTIGMLVYTSHLRQSRPRDTRTFQDFYHKTKDALDRSRGRPVIDSSTGRAKGQIPLDKDGDGDVDPDDDQLAREMAGRLRAAEQQAKDLANAKAPNKPDAPSSVVGVGSSAGGQRKKTAVGDERPDETQEEHAVEEEMDRILQQSPGTARRPPDPHPARSERHTHTAGDGEEREIDWLTAACPPCSHHLLQDLLPLL